MKIEVILFDIGNVFLKPIHGEIINLLFKKKNNNIEFDDYKNKVSLILNDSFEGKISLEETWRKLFELVNITEKKEEIVNGFKIIRNEELIKYVTEIISKKFDVGILSDLSQIGYSVFNNYYKDLYSLCDKDKVFISVNTGKTKSKDGFLYFEKIVSQLKVDPRKILFIDDEIANINNAKKTNINTILFESRDFNWSIANEKLQKKLKCLMETNY